MTNDGNAILREIDVSHPAAKVSSSVPLLQLSMERFQINCVGAGLQSIIELSRTQDEEVGDGTTSVIILGTSPGAAHSMV